MDKAVEGAIDVEYALQFGQKTVEVHAVQRTIEDKHLKQLTQTVERMAIHGKGMTFGRKLQQQPDGLSP